MTFFESIHLLPKNGKLMALIAILSIILTSTSLFLFVYSLQSLMVDMVAPYLQSSMPDPTSNFMPKTSPNPAQITSHLQQDLSLLLAIEIAFLISLAAVTFLSVISTIIISSVSYTGKNLSLKELLLRIGATWTRPLVTALYISCLTIGYFLSVVALLSPLVLSYANLAIMLPVVIVFIIAFIFYLYLFAGWVLAIVVSVLEESCYGIEALGKAAMLIEGKRLHSFWLIFCTNLVVFIISQGCKMIFGDKGFANLTIYALLSVSVSVLAKIFLVVMYTVLYFECKKQHGEEIEFHGSLEYTKLATDQLGNDMA